MTKRLIATAVSVTALLLGAGSTFAASAPAPVPSIADGFVSIAVGGKSIADSFDSDTASGVSLEGAASGEYNFSANLGFQGDLVLKSQGFSDSEFSEDRNVETAIHAFYRNDQYLVGGFGQYGNDSLTIDGFGEGLSIDHFYGGVEGQAFFGNATIYAQAGAKEFRFEGENIDGWFGTLEARYFLDPNFKIEAHVGGDTFGGGDDFLKDDMMTTVHVGIGTEYRLPQSPISLFAKYDYSQHTFAEPGAAVLSDNRVLVGAKFNFDTPTLIQRDRSGASLKPVENDDLDLFNFLR